MTNSAASKITQRHSWCVDAAARGRVDVDVVRWLRAAGKANAELRRVIGLGAESTSRLTGHRGAGARWHVARREFVAWPLGCLMGIAGNEAQGGGVRVALWSHATSLGRR